MKFSDVIEIEMTEVLLVTLGKICASTQKLCISALRISALPRNRRSYFRHSFTQSKPITIGVFYRPPNQAKFIDLMVKKFSNLNLKDKEIYLLRDFNINLFQNGKQFLNGKEAPTLKD